MKKYTDRYVEVHPSMVAIDVNDHVINHLPQRISLGDAIIVCERPAILAPAFSKRWHRVMRTLERTYASTLHSGLRREILRKLEAMRQTKFDPRPTTPAPHPTVWMVSPDTLTLPEGCATMYVTSALSNERIDHLIRQMPLDSAILVYRGGRDLTHPRRYI